MAIPLAGLFNHELVVARDASGTWTGQAAPMADASRHPGIVGEQPTVTLAGGVITLTRQTSILDLFNSNYRNGDNPAKWASFRVGSALEAVIEDGDVLRVSRFGTGDFAATLFRGGDFILGLGALRWMPLPDGMSIEEDPRAAEVDLYHLAADIRRPGTVFVWMDSSDPNVDAAIANLDHLAGESGIIAFTGRDPAKYTEVRRRVSERLPAPFHPAFTSMFRAASRRSKSGSRTWTNFRRHASQTCTFASILVPCRLTFARASTRSARHGISVWRRFTRLAVQANSPWSRLRRATRPSMQRWSSSRLDRSK